MALPTKTELLKEDLVVINQQHHKVITNTLQIAQYFKKRPSNINQRIASLSERGRLNIKPSYYLNQQGKEQKYYELNRDQFLLVVMGFTGDKADQFKAGFIALFNSQEAELEQWQEKALLASNSTKKANDNIYQLQHDLKAVIPNSMRCKMLFVHIQRAITKAVTGSAKTDRMEMTAHQLHKVALLEQKVNSEIERLRCKDLSAEQIRDEVLAMLKATNEKAHTSDQTREGLSNVQL